MAMQISIRSRVESRPGQSCGRPRPEPSRYRGHQEGWDPRKSHGVRARQDEQPRRQLPQNWRPLPSAQMALTNHRGRARCTPPNSVGGCTWEHPAISANRSDLLKVKRSYSFSRRHSITTTAYRTPSTPAPSQEEVTPVDLTSRWQNVQVAPQSPNLAQPEGGQTEAPALAEHVLAAPMWPRSKTFREEPPKQQEPESGSLSGSMGRNWVQLAADVGRPRNSLTIPIRRYPFGEARRVAPVIFMDHSSSPPTMTVIPATVLATFPAAMQARTVISTNDDAVRIGSGRDGNDGRKSQSYSKDDFFHGTLPEVIGPRLNDCPVFAFHEKTHFGLQSEETSDHWRTCGKPLWKPGKQ